MKLLAVLEALELVLHFMEINKISTSGESLEHGLLWVLLTADGFYRG